MVSLKSSFDYQSEDSWSSQLKQARLRVQVLLDLGLGAGRGGLAGRSGLGYDLCEEPPGFSLTCFDCCLIRSDTSLSGPPAFPSDAARRTSCQAALASLCWDVRRSPGRDFFFSLSGCRGVYPEGCSLGCARDSLFWVGEGGGGRNVSCCSPSKGFLFGRRKILLFFFLAHHLPRRRAFRPEPPCCSLLQFARFYRRFSRISTVLPERALEEEFRSIEMDQQLPGQRPRRTRVTCTVR